MGPAYVPKYPDSSPTVTTTPPEKVAVESLKRTTPVANEDYERGELGSSSTSSSGSDEDSNDSEDEKESNAKEIKPEMPVRGNFKKLTPSNPETIKSNPAAISDLVSPVKPVYLSVSQEESLKKLENEIKRLKEQLTENETQRLNQKKQYQSKISNLMAYNDQLLAITKHLSSVIESSTTKLTADQSKEKELQLQIQQVKIELSGKQAEALRIQDDNNRLKKIMDMYKQKFEERDYNTYQQTNQLLWGQIILWIFVVVIFVIVFSLFIKQTKMEV
jgi:DNA repair exonuclease SbcCD ATPase subunit